MEDSRNKEIRKDQLWNGSYYEQLTDEEKEAVAKAAGPEGFETVYPVNRVVAEYLQMRKDTYPAFQHFEVDASVTAEDISQRLSVMEKNYQALRSVIAVPEEGRPVHVVLKESRVSFFQADLRKLSEGEELSDRQKAYFTTLLRMEASSSTELGRTVTLRIGLVRISDQKSILHIAVSHLILDGRGFALVAAELLGRIKGKNDRELWQYYFWQFFEADRRPAIAYWKGLLGDSLHLTSLPDCSCGNETADFRMFYAPFGQSLQQDAVRFCEENQITPAVLMHFVLGKALLAALSVDEVRFLTVGSGRDKRLSDLPGMLMTLFPVRVRASDRVSDLKEQIHTSVKHSWVWNLPGQKVTGQPGERMLILDLVDFTLPGEGMARYLDPQLLTKGMRAEELMVTFPKGNACSVSLIGSVYQRLLFVGSYDASRHSASFIGELRSALIRCFRETVQNPGK